MTEILQMFLFLFKSKYRRKFYDEVFSFCVILCSLILITNIAAKCNHTSCGENGLCENGTCHCFDGWQGPQCQFCGGKVRLSDKVGNIHDGLGNYSLTSKCSWLIDAPNSTITLHIEEFATECGWDHLYVYDGDSVESPLLAVFSGLMYKSAYSVRRIPEIIANSGTVLLHFFSDDAYNMSGFNITYRLDSCPTTVSGTNCSGNGICIEGVCTCDGGWGGSACHLENCPNNCGAEEKRGVCEPEGCSCYGKYRGNDCSQIVYEGYWETVNVQGFTPPGSASHGVATWKDSMFVIAGESYNRAELMYVYDFNGNVWETQHILGSPSPRYGHSTVLYGDKIFLYGGVLGNRGPSSEFWAFDVSAQTWEKISVKSISCTKESLLCGPLKVAGHTATVVTNNFHKPADKMVVIFGYSPQFGYLNTVQEYYFGTREWHIVQTNGFPVKGGYGHTASWDPLTKMIYVYGGIISESESSQILSKHLYSYDPSDRIWTLLADAPSARFLHSAAFVSGGLMLVFGGNTHNDTSHSFGAKCYSSELLAYDVLCDTWTIQSVPKDLHADLARFGHSAVVFEGSLFIYGGFDGQMLSDILKYTPGDCQSSTETTCLNMKPGLKCVWNSKDNTCTPAMQVSKNQLFKKEENYITTCSKLNRSVATSTLISNKQKCGEMDNCVSCVQTTSGCVWCGTSCNLTKKCSKSLDNTTDSIAVMKLSECPLTNITHCKQIHTCNACTSQLDCRWKLDHGVCESRPIPADSSVDLSQKQSTSSEAAILPGNCQPVCAELTSCLNCTREECIWCQNEGRCIDKNAYTSSFPYGQCREWTTIQSKCRSKGNNDENSQCGFYKTCAKCRDDPACGWCDDGSKTGLGTCMPGGNTGPTLHTQSLPSSTCPLERWHFTDCPVCQCNGHASCIGNSSTCKACGNLTTGAHCEYCMKGFHGNPVNGGKCTPCTCNNRAEDCNRESGKCYCTTKGIIGDQCEKCDTTNHYHSDPSSNKSCYYDLTIDYQFTFNLSKKEDRHYTQINFRNSPVKSDIDADFLITCSVLAKMNITVREGNSPERELYSNQNCTTFKSKFSKSSYHFGMEDNVTQTTFYVYVYDFQPPLWIQISFSQYPKLNLQQFFITFSSCFLLLLLVAAILWKIKQRYDIYRRRQRLFVEMEQMASRPFSQVLVELGVKEKLEINKIEDLKLRKVRDAPSPVALEPCFGNKAAVLSLLVLMPTSDTLFPMKGRYAGLAVASALVTLGNPRKMSIDQAKFEIKGGKLRKSQSQHPDSCL